MDNVDNLNYLHTTLKRKASNTQPQNVKKNAKVKLLIPASVPDWSMTPKQFREFQNPLRGLELLSQMLKDELKENKKPTK